MVSTTHAAVAVVHAIYWLTATDELQQSGTKPFIFLPINASISAIGGAYFVYDTIATIFCFSSVSPSFFWSVLLHHVIFVVAYFSTLVRASYM